jgi:hypothetical protein
MQAVLPAAFRDYVVLAEQCRSSANIVEPSFRRSAFNKLKVFITVIGPTDGGLEFSSEPNWFGCGNPQQNGPAKPEHSAARACIGHKSLRICEQQARLVFNGRVKRDKINPQSRLGFSEAKIYERKI